MKYTSYQFRQQVDKAVIAVRRILDTARDPCLASPSHDHHYNDKYELAQLLTNAALASFRNVLQHMGVSNQHLETMRDWVQVHKKAVTLRFEAEQTCEMVGEEHLEVTLKDSEEVDGRIRGLFYAFKRKVKSTRNEYHWKVGHNFKLTAYAGTSTDGELILCSRTASAVVNVKETDKSPFPESWKPDPFEVDCTWLLEHMGPSDGIAGCNFCIDRSDPQTCKTPRRNEQVKNALTCLHSFSSFASQLEAILRRLVPAIMGELAPFPIVEEKSQPNLPKLSGLMDTLFCPILPLFESNDQAPPLLSPQDMDALLNEQERTLRDALLWIEDQYPCTTDTDQMVSTTEATLLLLARHVRQLAVQYQNAVNHIEHMLTEQLIAAIGKEIEREDFDDYMSFHYKTVYGAFQAPAPFCYAVRQPGQFPDGMVSIEAVNNSTNHSVPIETFTRKLTVSDETPPFRVPLNAAISLEITGDRFLHGWLRHIFSDNKEQRHQLVTRARQFSCLILMVGTIAGPDQFDLKDAIILQNKDEVLIPLLLEMLPTAKAFKDAVASLSPEQRRFAESFRAMQLESSVFGICLVQVKPQLESLLNLPPGSLSKEIKLTQDLLSLFIDYQIPSHLLSYDGPVSTAGKREKVTAVREHTQAVLNTIQANRHSQLEAEVQKSTVQTFQSQSPSPSQAGIEEAHYWYSTLQKEIEDVEDILFGVESISEGAERTRILEKLAKRLRAADCIKRSFKMAIRLVADVNARRFYERRVQQCNRSMLKLKADLEGLRRGSIDSPGCELIEASVIQTKTQDSLANTKAFIAESKEDGMATLEELERQRCVLSNLEKECVKMDGAPASFARSFFASVGFSGEEARLDNQVPVPRSRPMGRMTTKRNLSIAKNPEMVSALAQKGHQATASNSAELPDVCSDDDVDANVPPNDWSRRESTPQCETHSDDVLDFTKIPKALNSKFEAHDRTNSLRATIIKPSTSWTRTHQENLLAKRGQKNMAAEEVKKEKDRAVDLLDALSRSGSLPLPYSELHVVIAASHCFQNDILGTVIQDNVDPIEHVEQSSLLLASTIHNDNTMLQHGGGAAQG